MGFGRHFESSEDDSEVRNQILQTPDKVDDRKDASDAKDNKTEKTEQINEKTDDSEKEVESKRSNDVDSEHKSKFDSLKEKFNAFKEKLSKSEEGEKPDVQQKTDGTDEKKETSFTDRLREGAPSLEEQAEMAKNLPGRDEYLEAREKSEKAKSDYPDLKDWELTPEQLEEANQGLPEKDSDTKVDDKNDNDE